MKWFRWRANSREFARPLSKKGLLRGYIKYGIFTYMAWHYGKNLFSSGHHHGDHGHGHSHDAHGHAEQGHGHSDKGHGHDSHSNEKAHHWFLFLSFYII